LKEFTIWKRTTRNRTKEGEKEGRGKKNRTKRMRRNKKMKGQERIGRKGR
jgi:hypothetical protein